MISVDFVDFSKSSYLEETMLLPFVNHMKKTQCFAGDFMDDQWSFRNCVQNQGLLMKFSENMNFLFFMKVQIILYDGITY